MRIAVPKETAAGERRVALVPEVVRKLTAAGHEVLVEAGAGAAAMIPDALFEEAGRDARATPPHLGRRRRGQGRAAQPRGDRPPGLRQRPDRLPPAADRGRRDSRAGRLRRHRVRAGGRAAHLARAVDGRAVLAGQRRRLPRRAARRRAHGPLLPDADDRRGHDPARPRCWCSAPASPACRRSPPRAGSARRSTGFDVRPRSGAGRVARRELPRVRPRRRRRGRGRLRARADRRGEAAQQQQA